MTTSDFDSELEQIERLVALLRLDPCELYAYELREHAGSVVAIVRRGTEVRYTVTELGKAALRGGDNG